MILSSGIELLEITGDVKKYLSIMKKAVSDINKIYSKNPMSLQ